MNNRKQKGNKYRHIIFIVSGCLILFVLAFCKNEQKYHHGKQGYRIVENANDLSDCSVYSMILDHPGGYVFRFALSGSCPTLTKERLLEYYTDFLEKYNDSLDIKKGQLIHLDFYKERGIDKNTIEKIALVTGDIVKKQVTIKEFFDDSDIAILEIL